MPINARLLLLALLFTVPVVVLALLQFQRETGRIQAAATAAVGSATDALARRLEQDLTGAEAVARTIGAVELLQPSGAATCSLAMTRAAVAAGPRITNYIVAAPSGQVLCSGQAMQDPVSIGDRPHVQQALQARRPELSGLLLGRVSWQDSIQLVVPILDATDRVTGLASAALAAEQLMSGIRPETGMRLTLLLFDRDGVLVGRAPYADSIPRGYDAADSELFLRRVELAAAAAQAPGLDGVPRLYSSRAIRFNGDVVLWAMGAVDVNALRAATLAAGSRDLGTVLLLATLVAGLAFVGTRTLVRKRYRGLSEVAAHVAVGHYSSRVQVTVADDITAVELALNAMLDAVEADRTKLEQGNSALQREIASRQASESALCARELELKDARRVAGLGSWGLDADGSVRWSPECFEIFGRDPAQGTPSRTEQAGLLTAASLAAMQSSLRAIRADGQAREVELEGVRPDGTHRWVLARGEAVRDASGAVTGARGTVLDITGRKLGERAVQRSQRHLQHVMDGLAPSVFVALLTPQGVLVEVNQSALTAAGVTARDVLGLPFADGPWWRGAAEARRMLAAAIERAAEGQSSRFEMQVRDRDGGRVDMDFSLQPLRDEAGKVIFLIPSAIVITERKRAEEALRDSEAEFRALAESMPQIVWMTRPDGWNIYFNQRWIDYSGLTLEESYGHGWIKPFHPEDRQRAQDAWLHATTTVTTYVLEARLRRSDGAYRWWLLRGVPQRDAAGTLLKWVGTCTDIDDLKQAELQVLRANGELQQKQTELRVLFDLMPAQILFKDTDNRILRINQNGADAAGLPVDQIEGRLAQDIYPTLGAIGHLADLEIVRSGRPQLGVTDRIRNREGSEMWIQRDRVPYRDIDGHVIGIVLMVQDITQRKRDQDALTELNADLESRVRDRTEELSLARSQAEEANRAKSDFLAAMSHEIRTPMSGLLGLLELLQLSALDGDQHATLGLARDSGSTLLSIIDDILDFSKIEANRLELNLVASPVRSVIAGVCRLHAQVASRKDLVLHCDVAAQVAPLLAVDPLRLGQILNNFVSNAIKFTEAGRIEVLVDLVAQRDGIQDLRFTVRDTGIGMSHQQLGRLFQPFVQAQVTTSATFGGTGLGLVIARRLAELMGGTVHIDSEPGAGTTLTLLLSLEVCEASAAAPAPDRGRRELLESLVAGRRAAPSVGQAQAEGTLLLVVDDHPTNRQVLVRQLASLGYAALAAVDGVEALALWRGHRFAAVITDCNMPLMNGYELAVAIRREEQREGLARTPVIACTANALPAAVDSCLAAGMDDYLVKPADLALVSRKLQRWVPLPAGQALPAPLPTRPPAAPPDGLLDLDVLAQVSGGCEADRRAILADFRRANDLDAAGLRSAADAGDMAQLMNSAHRIKGASLMVGAALLSQSCVRVECAGAAADPAGLRAALDSFEAELLRLNDYLEALA